MLKNALTMTARRTGRRRGVDKRKWDCRSPEAFGTGAPRVLAVADLVVLHVRRELIGRKTQVAVDVRGVLLGVKLSMLD